VRHSVERDELYRAVPALLVAVIFASGLQARLIWLPVAAVFALHRMLESL
jgi:hypothetical protein